MRDLMQRPIAARSGGFTLLEVVVSMTLLLVVLAIAVPFLQIQAKSVGNNAGRFDAQQNASFGVNAVDRELRMGGIGVVRTQPLIVQAQGDAVTFNADMVSRVGIEIGAVYFDSLADPGTTVALAPPSAVTLPNSLFLYPTVAHRQPSGIASAAETISFWVEADSVADRFRLMRRVNDADPETLAADLVVPSGQPVFRYYVPGPNGALQEIAAASLPLFHNAGTHGAPEDTGVFALVDSIRLVRMSLTGVYEDRQLGQQLRTEERSIRIANSGLIVHSTCGDSPSFASAITAVGSLAGEPPAVTVTWNPSGDDGAAENDIQRYTLYRRRPTEPVFGEPFASIAAGLPAYSVTDSDVEPGDTWIYGVAAQDCTPANSAMRTSGVAAVPVL